MSSVRLRFLPVLRGGPRREGGGYCTPTLGALRPIEGAWVRTHLFGAFLDTRYNSSKMNCALVPAPNSPVPTLCAWACIRFVLQGYYSARKAAEEQGIIVRGDRMSILIVLRFAAPRRISAGFFKDTKSVFDRVWCLRARALGVRRAAGGDHGAATGLSL